MQTVLKLKDGKIVSDKVSGESVCENFSQVGHGLGIGDVVRFNSGSWVKAQANTGLNSEATAIVSEVVDVDNLKVCYSGRINGLSGLTPDCVYFLSDTTAGLLTLTEPSGISKPILFATSATSAILLIMRGLDSQAGSAIPIEVQDEGSQLTSNVKKFNFVGGGVTVTEPAADEMLVTIPSSTPSVFGQDYAYSESEADSLSPSTSLQTKVTLNTTSLNPSHTYRVGYNFTPGCDTNSVVVDYEIHRNDVAFDLSSFEADSDRHEFAGFKHYTGLSGVQTFKIKYKSNGTANAQIRTARLEFWRVN